MLPNDHTYGTSPGKPTPQSMVADNDEATGRFIDAKRATELGLVSRVVDKDQLEAEAQGFVDDMLHATPLGLRLTKECLRMSLDAPSLEAAIAMEDRNQILAATGPVFMRIGRHKVPDVSQGRTPAFTPGPATMNGTRNPPSQTVPLPPASGGLRPGVPWSVV